MTQRPFTGRHMLAIMLAFFGIVVAVNVTMAMLARASWTGLVVPNSYVASQNFNKAVEAARAQDALGWVGSLATQEGGLVFKLTDGQGRDLAGLGVSARIGRPIGEAQDRDVAFAPGKAGHYVADLSLAPGEWRVELVARDGDEPVWRRDFRLYAR